MPELQKYPYEKNVQNLNLDQLTYEIEKNGTITTNLDHIDFRPYTFGTNIDIYFDGIISGAEETVLNSIVTATPNNNIPVPTGDICTNILSGGIYGLRIKPDNNNPAYQIRIINGAARDSTEFYTMSLSSYVTVDITASGANGLDTGSEAADTWYSVYLIGDTSGANATAGLFSTDAETPTLPNGYNVFRRIGWVKNDSSSDFWMFRHIVGSYARRYYWSESSTSTLDALENGSATSWTEVDLSSFIPPTAYNVQLLIRYKTGLAGNNNNDVSLRTKGEDSQKIQLGPGAIIDSKMKIPIEMSTNNLQKIEYKVDDAENRVDIAVLGYDDEV